MDKYVVRTASGEVDIIASVEAYETALNKWVEENEADLDRIEAAVETVFNKFPGRLVMGSVAHFALRELNAGPTEHGVLEGQILKYIRGQAKIGRLDIGKGKGNGGVLRLAKLGEPIPEKPSKK